MDQNSIKEPNDIKNLSIDELNNLAKDIRSFIIESVSKTGGHLASNLGVIELTIALHYVFDSPKDKIFFDVGHQCYTHKILTGRANDFSTLKQYEGLSGFQKRNESIHDVWEAGHSSTALSAALGMAVSRDLNNENYCIVPVVGDGAMASGMSLEALNQIGSIKSNMIIIFNDNNMSISKNVGALNNGFSKLRTSKAYTDIKSGMRKNLINNGVGQTIYSGLKSIKDSFKNAVIDGGVFEEFNIDYLGPIDGHNIKELIKVFKVAKEHQGPIVLHISTKKGKGYAPCENDREGIWHGVGKFDIETGKMKKDIPENHISYAKLVNNTIEELAETNEDIVAITPAMIQGSALTSFFAKYPNRSFDCGIAEEHATTFAAGLAINGKRPFLCMYSSFLQRAYDQINHDICRMDLPVVIGVDHAGLVGEDGETHHGIFDLSLLLPLDNIIISQGKDANETKSLVYTAFKQNHPFVIRYPKTIIEDNSKEYEDIPIGSWELLNDKESNKAYILSYGDDVRILNDKIIENDLPITIVNCRYFKPIDTNLLETIAKSQKNVYLVESDAPLGGLSSIILSYLNNKNIPLNIRIFSLKDIYIKQGSNRQLRKEQGIDSTTVRDTVLKEISV